MANTDTRKLLVKSLEDMYALEAHLVQVLHDHAKDAQGEPLIRQKIEQHLHETELHRDRIEQRLQALGTNKPGFKTTMTNVLGQMLGGMSGSSIGTLAKNARDEYTSEHLEIACYVELITLAQSLGDADTVRVAQLNLRDEVAMQQWLIQHLPEATLKGLQQEGVQVPANALTGARSLFADAGLEAFGGQQQPFGTPQQPYQTPPMQNPPPVIS
jgi:ferritin-like metal-binding protein YciE